MNIESSNSNPEHSNDTAAGWVRSLSRAYPDFPSPGILFRDLTPVFADGGAFGSLVDALCDLVEPGVTAIAGVEARGFILAAAMAQKTGCGILAIRKAGKLPGAVMSESYALEYGTATLELHPDALSEGSKVVLVDDLLATGGTLAAAVRLIERIGCHVAGIGVVIELGDLAGRLRLAPHRVDSIVRA